MRNRLSFSLKCKGRELRQELCKVAYLYSLIRRVEDGEISEKEAEELKDKAEFNIDTFGLTIDASPIFYSVLGISKAEEMAQYLADEQVNNDVHDIMYHSSKRL